MVATEGHIHLSSYFVTIVEAKIALYNLLSHLNSRLLESKAGHAQTLSRLQMANRLPPVNLSSTPFHHKISPEVDFITKFLIFKKKNCNGLTLSLLHEIFKVSNMM